MGGLAIHRRAAGAGTGIRQGPVRGPAAVLPLAIVALLIASPASSLAKGTASSPGGTIYFNRVTTPADTYAIQGDGTGLRAVGCPGDRTYRTPRRIVGFEPTGATFAAYTEALRWQEFAVMRIVSRDEACGDAQVLAELPSGYRTGDLVWSIDGRRIAADILVYDGAGQLSAQGIWVGEVGGACGAPLCDLHQAATFPMEPVVGQPAGTTPTAFYEHLPFLSWSADGHRVLDNRRDTPGTSNAFRIFLADLGLPGSTASLPDARVPVPGGAAEQWDPAFSPVAGDDRIAFAQLTSTKGCARYDLFVIPAGGGPATQVTTTRNMTACQAGRPDWSPDGQWLSFDAWPGGFSAGQSIYRIAADGSTKAVVLAATSGVNYYAPRWRP